MAYEDLFPEANIEEPIGSVFGFSNVVQERLVYTLYSNGHSKASRDAFIRSKLEQGYKGIQITEKPELAEGTQWSTAYLVRLWKNRSEDEEE